MQGGGLGAPWESLFPREPSTGIEVEPDLASPGEAGCTDWPSRPQSRLLVLGGGVRWVDPVLVEGSEGL